MKRIRIGRRMDEEGIVMWQDKLEEIKQVSVKFNDTLNDGITDKELEALISGVEKELQVSLPEAYIDVLKLINGLEFNGYILYGADKELLENIPNQRINGLIDNNKVWYDNEWEKKYLFLGDSSISWYAYDVESGSYFELDKPSGDEMQEFSCFEEMLEKILTDALL